MRCAHCQKVIPDGIAYCAYCGAKAAAGGGHAPAFRFARSADQAVTLKDLAYLIDRNWEVSLQHLYEGDFANWLGSLGRGVLADQAREIVKSYPEDRQVGLELFISLVSDAANAGVPSASPELSPKTIDFGAVPRDSTAQARLVITNRQDRGYLSGRVRVPPGVSWLSFAPREFAGPRTEITLTVNTRDMPAAAQHRTRLLLTTSFETVESEVSLRVATEWSALLRAMRSWALAGGGVLLAASGAALLLSNITAEVPWPVVYLVLATVSAFIVFGSVRTRDPATACAVSALMGLVMLIPICLGALALGFLLALLNYQTTTIAQAASSTTAALAVMAALGVVLGFIGGLFDGLRRVGRSQAGCVLAAVLLAALVTGAYTFRPSLTFGEFRSNQPLLTDLIIPVPYLAFSATATPAFAARPPTLPTVAAAPTASPQPTPPIRGVQNVTMLWEVVPVTEGAGAEAYLHGLIDSEGRPHVAYIAPGEEGVELRYATLEGGRWVNTSVDTGALAYAALALDADGHPHIAYARQADLDAQVTLYQAAWDGASWSIEPVDGPGAGRWPAIVIDGAGRPTIVYFDGRETGLKIARRVSGEWQLEGVDLDGDVGYCPSLALDPRGLPHVVYVDRDGAALRYGRYDGERWLVDTVPYERRAGCDTALALDPETSQRYVLFYDLDAGLVVQAVYQADAWQFAAIGPARPLADGRLPLSLALDAQGRARLTFNGPSSLRYARYDGAHWQSAVVDGPSPAHQVVIDGAGQSHIAYLYQGSVWYATLRPGVVSTLPTTPTPGPGPTPATPTFFCGDGICQDPEGDCETDCRGKDWTCGNEICEEEGEDPLTCPADCAEGD
jgi:hypothetical protein